MPATRSDLTENGQVNDQEANIERAQQKVQEVARQAQERTQETSLEAVRAGDQAVLEAARGWSETFGQYIPKVLYIRPTEAIDSAFDFLHQLLETQREFLHQLVGVFQVAKKADNEEPAQA